MTLRSVVRRARLRGLDRDQQGVTIVEFAIVAPVLCVMLLGAFDMGHTLYVRAVLEGTVQKAARDASLEAGTDAQVLGVIDQKVEDQLTPLGIGAAEIRPTRRFYRTFNDAAAARAETWTDSNANGTCDEGEPYDDENHNQVWDSDGGNDGQGGAKDATLYTVRVSYPRLFPIDRLIGGSDTTNLSASTVLRNQPYGDQGSYEAAQVRNCT
ncbi:MAG: pilus assembly protein [Alphaproteobacteria bacterium]|nr:pilus assembly protein [Alphaproteobacteria bacterium]MBU1756743.1 pilus assembly protein [Alphaproteobacteria bacterium]